MNHAPESPNDEAWTAHQYRTPTNQQHRVWTLCRLRCRFCSSEALTSYASRRIIFCAAVSLLAACSNGGGSDSSSTAPTLTGPATTYVGAFASASWSGTLSVQVSTGTAAAISTVVFIDGTSAYGSGSLSASTQGLFINGSSSGFLLTGGLSNGALTGTVLSGIVTGAFVASPIGTGGVTAKVMCGTFAGSSVGFWNIVILSTGTVSGVTAALGTGNTTTLAGTLSGNAITLTSSDSGTAQGTLATDGSSVSGTWSGAGPSTGSSGAGTFQAGAGTCGTTIPGTPPATTPPPNVAGSWMTSGSNATGVSFAALLQSGSSISGSGLLATAPLAPTSGPSSPPYVGNSYTITGGDISNSAVTFTAALGGSGTLSFAGKFTDASTLTGTLTFTPPATASQTFAAQSMTGFTFTKQ